MSAKPPGDRPASSQSSETPQRGSIALGLQVALFLLVSFFLLHYSAYFSILMGIMGGGAAGLISQWWQTSDSAEDTVSPLDLASVTGREQIRKERQKTRVVRTKPPSRRRQPTESPRSRWFFGRRF